MELSKFLEKYKDLIPINFDWQFYVTYYADLMQAGINNEQLAKCHYINYGRYEKRKYVKEIIDINKIFQIGFNKCGTCSIHSLFKNYAMLPSIHWDDGNLAKTIHHNIQTGEHLPLDGYDQYIVYTDMECFTYDNNDLVHICIAPEYFDILDINYPNSIFIFNTRPIDNWIKSRLSHKFLHNGTIWRYIDMYKQVLKTQNTDTIINYWKTQYYSHEKKYKRIFC